MDLRTNAVDRWAGHKGLRLPQRHLDPWYHVARRRVPVLAQRGVKAKRAYALPPNIAPTRDKRTDPVFRFFATLGEESEIEISLT